MLNFKTSHIFNPPARRDSQFEKLVSLKFMLKRKCIQFESIALSRLIAEKRKKDVHFKNYDIWTLIGKIQRSGLVNHWLSQIDLSVKSFHIPVLGVQLVYGLWFSAKTILIIV